jgi:uncharacterized membrane protein YkvA (DUF1232 family)
MSDEPINAEVIDILPGKADDFYLSFRQRIRTWFANKGKSSTWSEYILAAPDFLHLLCKLSIDRDVPATERARLAAALAYFILPADLIPELIAGPAGYVDDVALAAYVVNFIAKTVDPIVLRRHWAGHGDILDLIERVLKVADRMVGSGLWNRLKKLVT